MIIIMQVKMFAFLRMCSSVLNTFPRCVSCFQCSHHAAIFCDKVIRTPALYSGGPLFNNQSRGVMFIMIFFSLLRQKYVEILPLK